MRVLLPYSSSVLRISPMMAPQYGHIFSINGDEVSTGENLGDLGHGDDFLEATLKA